MARGWGGVRKESRLGAGGAKKRVGLQEQQGQEEHFPCRRPGVPVVPEEKDPLGRSRRAGQVLKYPESIMEQYRAEQGSREAGLMGEGGFWTLQLPYGPEEQVSGYPPQNLLRTDTVAVFAFSSDCC